jgi:hypothetical protein
MNLAKTALAISFHPGDIQLDIFFETCILVGT